MLCTDFVTLKTVVTISKKLISAVWDKKSLTGRDIFAKGRRLDAEKGAEQQKHDDAPRRHHRTAAAALGAENFRTERHSTREKMK